MLEGAAAGATNGISGAALAINQAGECEFCAVVVTTGEFDWVLSRIEQDDSYSG
jgi:hypothetical protein